MVNPNSASNKKVLITGAYGNIGRHLMAGLPASWQLTGLDKRTGNDPRVIVGDINSMETTGLAPGDFDVAIHLAADPDESHNFAELLGPNIIGCTAFLQWCAHGGIRRLIYASSCQPFFGRLPNDGPIKVDSPYRPCNIYGCAKVYGEMLCHMHHLHHGCDTLAVRLGAVLPEAMDRDLQNDPDYQQVRLPQNELIEAFRRFVIEPWSGSQTVFLGPISRSFLPTRESLDALFGLNV